ncbi:MAG: Ca-activated chloride channel family protein, partial [Verrucomicrobiales bacterium]
GRDVLAIGRADLLAQSKELSSTNKDSLESELSVALDSESTEPVGFGKRQVSMRLFALCGAVAACVAFSVSWMNSEWQQDGLFAEDEVLGNDRQESRVFASSDVAGFDEPEGLRLSPPIEVAEIQSASLALDAEIDDALSGKLELVSTEAEIELEEISEIPRSEVLSGETRYGAGTGALAPRGRRFPRAQKSPSDLGSRVVDDVPEPPEGWQSVADERLESNDLEQSSESVETPYRWTRESSVSQIPTEVDSVSYNNVRRYLRQGEVPPRDSVHVEDMINFFDYAKPAGDGIFGVDVERAICPWQPEHHLVRVAVQASDTAVKAAQPARNYVFLVDSSGSMRTPSRLGMLSESAAQLVASLGLKDRVTIFTYEDDTVHLVAGPLSGNRRDTIRYAFANLDQSRELTGTPIRVAFRAARNAMIANGENRVILMTDEHLLAGVGTAETLVELARLGKNCDIGLTVAGVGGGVLNSQLLSRLEVEAGVESHYLDGSGDAARFFGKALAKPATVLANRVEINVDFNSEIVRSFRLLGFARRPIESGQRSGKPSDVRDGFALNALYEVIPMAAPVEMKEMGEHGSWAERESDRKFASTLVEGQPLLSVSLLYDPVGASLPKHTIYPVPNDPVKGIQDQSADFQFSAAVAGYGMLLRESPYGENVSTEMVRELAKAGLTVDPYGLRREFVELVRASETIPNLP